MGEIDNTKPIESVQAALSLFEEKYCVNNSTIKHRTPTCVNEMENDKYLTNLLKDLANVKVELETKDYAHKQALLKLDHQENTADELSALLMSSELEKVIYMNQCSGLKIHILELESRIQDMDDRLLESVKIREQLSHAIIELKATQGELLIAETEIVTARAAKVEAITKLEMIETDLSMEKLKTDELSREVLKFNETMLHLRKTVTETEEDCAMLHESAAQIKLEAENAQGEVEYMREQLKLMQHLENESLEKSALMESLKLEIQQLNEAHTTSEKIVSENRKLKENLELQERKNWDQSGYISLLESELRQLRGELCKANEEAARANADVQTISTELEDVKKEIARARENESEAQVEIAYLKSELHKGRSKIAAAEVAGSVAKSEKSALHLALQQLALEVEDAKDENKRLREACEEIRNTTFEEAHEVNSRPVHEETNEIQLLKKELKAATVKISEARTRAEQAISRAEAAEKAKAALEDQIKRWREHKERKMAALAALKEETMSTEIAEYKPPDHATTSKSYQPLGKVLKMKF